MKKTALLFLAGTLVLSSSVNAQNTSIDNPNQEILSVNKEVQTRSDLYDALKISGTFKAALDTLDYKVMDKKFKDNKKLSSIIEKLYNEKEKELKEKDIKIEDDYALYGTDNKDEYILKSGLRLEGLRELAETEIANKDIFTQAEKDYIYQTEFSAKNKIYAILISPNLSDKELKEKDATDKGLADSLKKAEEIKSGIKDLEQFKKAANEKSADRLFKDGYIGEFTVASAHSAKLEQNIIDAAFSVKAGEVSAPVLTKYGYYLVMSEEVEKAPTYESVEQDVLEKLYDLYKDNNPYFESYALFLYREANKAGFGESILEKNYANSFLQFKKSYLQYSLEEANPYGNFAQ